MTLMDSSRRKCDSKLKMSSAEWNRIVRAVHNNMLHPLTAEQADAEMANADEVPISREQIDDMVDKITKAHPKGRLASSRGE